MFFFEEEDWYLVVNCRSLLQQLTVIPDLSGNSLVLHII